MPHTINPLIGFNAGEWSPAMDSRIDLPGYRKACRRLRNMVPMKTGAVTRRPGTQFIAKGKLSHTGAPSVSRMQEFQYSPSVTFMLEFCDQGIRFYSNGAQVQVSSPAAWVSGSTYKAGSFVTNGGITYYLFNGPIVNDTTAPGSDPNHWVSQTAYEVPAPYLGTNFTAPNYWAADVFNLTCCQINDVVYIVHPSYPVYKLLHYSNSNWAMQQVVFNTPPMMDQNATDTTIAATSGGSAPAAWAPTTAYTAGQSFTYNTGTWLVIVGYTSGTYFGPEIASGYVRFFSPVITTTYTLSASAPGWGTGKFYSRANSVTSGGIIYACQQAHVSGTFATDLANGLWALVTVFQASNIGGYFQLAYCRPASSVTIQAVASGSDWVFTAATTALITLIGQWELATYGTWTGTLSLQASYDNGVNWQVIDTLTSIGDANYNISGKDLTGGMYQLVITGVTAQASQLPPRVVFTAANQFVYNVFQITGYTNAYSATAALVSASSYSNSATTFWSEGAWSMRRGYPQAVRIFQERLWFGFSSAQPQRMWGSQTDDLENFAPVDESDATYGLVFDLNAPGRGPIQWITSQTDLMIGLAGAEWVITSGQSSTAISATAVQALEHSANGSAPGVPGEVIGQAAFYVQRKGTAFQQMMFSVMTEKYMSQNMQLLSQHLTAARVKQFDYQPQFHEESLIWAVCGDGSLISMTYDLQSEIFAWAKHTTGDLNVSAADMVAGTTYTIETTGSTENPQGITDFTAIGAANNLPGASFVATGAGAGSGIATNSPDFGFISVQIIMGAPGQDDEVWVSVQREGESQSSIERICPTDWQTADVGTPDLTLSCYADRAITFTSPATNVLAGFTASQIGRSVVASINGSIAVSGLTVAGDSTVTIPNYEPVSGDVVIVGYPINWTVQPMRLDVTAGGGQIPGMTKAISKLYLRTLNSIGGNWATRQGDATPLPTYQNDFVPGQPPPFYPDVPQEIEVDVGQLMQYETDPQFTIQGSDPLPFTLLGITIKQDIGGTA